MYIEDHHIIIGNATDKGRIRELNEDYMAHFGTAAGYCIVICDGMGGLAAGDVASQNATAAIQQYLQDSSNQVSNPALLLTNAIEFANFQLKQMAKDPSVSDMGTTCVLLLIKNGWLYTAHAGDSRAYLIRNKKIKQLTKDHSSVQQMVDRGIITQEEAKTSHKRNEIVKAIGVFDKVQPDVTKKPVPLHKNDKILLCTDGLTTHVEDAEIFEIILSSSDVQTAAVSLVEKANEKGGTDNITVQLIDYTGKTQSDKLKPFRKRAIITLSVCILLALLFWGYTNYKGNIVNKKANANSTTNQENKDTANHNP